jgi:hypothetical protein
MRSTPPTALFAKAIDAHEVVTILDTRKSNASKQHYGQTYLDGADWGMKSDLKSKSAAVTAYLRAMDMAHKRMISRSDQEIPQILD